MLANSYLLAASVAVSTFSFIGAAHAQNLLPENSSVEDCVLDPTDVYAQSSHSIYKVLTLDIDPMRLAERVQSGSGSAIALGDGYFLTNYHVVGRSDEVMLVSGEAFFVAFIVGGDPALDVAVLYSPEAEFADPSAELQIAPQSQLQPGQSVYALGYPLGGGLSISGGMISAVDRLLPLNTLSWMVNYIQTDAAISPGSSGGALVDECGRMLGMVTLKSMTPGAENIAYALPNETLLPLIEELIAEGRVARAWHGIYGQMATPLILAIVGADPEGEVAGFLVETVEPGSAADRAGLLGGYVPVLWGMGEFILGGDIITHVNDRAILSIEDAIDVVEGLKIGDTVKISFLRDGEPLSASVELEERPIFESDAHAYTLR